MQLFSTALDAGLMLKQLAGRWKYFTSGSSASAALLTQLKPRKKQRSV
jgi:hypothetical protein